MEQLVQNHGVRAGVLLEKMVETLKRDEELTNDEKFDFSSYAFCFVFLTRCKLFIVGEENTVQKFLKWKSDYAQGANAEQAFQGCKSGLVSEIDRIMLRHSQRVGEDFYNKMMEFLENVQ